MRIHGPYRHRSKWRLAFREQGGGARRLIYRSFATKAEAEVFMRETLSQQDNEALGLLKADTVELPVDPSWVYMLLDSAGQVVYVGLTRELDRRYYTHRELGMPFERMVFFPDVVDRCVGLRIEAALIRKHNPPLNTAGAWTVPQETDRYVPRAWTANGKTNGKPLAVFPITGSLQAEKPQ
jgi:hypothetical protein